MKIDKLNPDQEKAISIHIEQWLDKVFKYELYQKNTFDSVKESVLKLYDFCGLKKPIVLFLDSPYACQVAANMFKNLSLDQVRGQVRGQVWGQKLEYITFSNYGNSSDFGWLSFYNYFLKETDVKIDKSKDLELCIDFAESCFVSIQLDGLCIVSKYPKSIHRNQNNDMHNPSGFAIEFADGYGQNYVNGRYLEPLIFLNSQSLDGARNEFMKADNEDIKACIITIVKENFGNTGLMQMLNSVLIDEKVINHTDDYSETLRIYHSKDKHSFLQNSKGELNQPYAWIEMTCPSTGNVYLIDTCPTFKNAIECAKWHRPEIIPNTLDYNWISAN